MYFLIPCNHVYIAQVLAQLPWQLSSMSVVFNRLRTTFKILKVWGNKGTKESGLATHAPTLATISFNTLSHLHVVVPTDASATNYRGVIPVAEHIETLKLRPIQNFRHFADDIFKSIFLNQNWYISLKISLTSVHMFWINSIPAFFQIMAWRRPDDKPLSEPMVVSLLMHIYASHDLNGIKFDHNLVRVMFRGSSFHLIEASNNEKWHEPFP